ncbi:MAG: hypothetical protein ACOX6J_04715 [Oscillospiraceae bacterium]|jgi:hypothetical protein
MDSIQSVSSYDRISGFIDDIVESMLIRIRESLVNDRFYEEDSDYLGFKSRIKELQPVAEEGEAVASPVAARAHAKAVFNAVAWSVLVIFAAFCVFSACVMEFWVPAAADTYVYPEAESFGSVDLSVGDSYTLLVPLGSNEEVKYISVEDPDILQIDGSTVTALGEYYSTEVKVYVGEISVPEQEQRYSGVTLFGYDISGFLNSWRTTLRDFFGIEEAQEERTLTRITAIYSFDVHIEGTYNSGTTEDIGLIYTGSRQELNITLAEGEYIESVTTSDGTILQVTEEVDSEGVTHYYIEGLADGTAEVLVNIGYLKEVSGVEYSQYLASNSEG